MGNRPPHSGGLNSILRQMLETYGKKIRYIYTYPVLRVKMQLL